MGIVSPLKLGISWACLPMKDEFVLPGDEKILVLQYDLRQLTFADLVGGTVDYGAHRPTIRPFF